MYIDAQTKVWDAAALTATAVSTNVVDLGGLPAVHSANGSLREIGSGTPVGFALSVGVAADHTTGDETYEFDIITSTASDGTTGQLIIAKYVVLFSALTAGALLFLPIPPLQAGAAVQQFVGLKYVGGGTTPTVTVTAWLTLQSMIQAQTLYPTELVIN